MKHETDFSDLFDDDFEVTYDDGWEDADPGPDITYSRDTGTPFDDEPDDGPTHDMDVRRAAVMTQTAAAVMNLKEHAPPAADPDGACLWPLRSAEAAASSLGPRHPWYDV